MKFALGAVITTVAHVPAGHTRLPHYLSEKRGWIVAVRGVYPLADARARGVASPPETLYTVGFDAAEVWGANAEARVSLYADLWESYLVGA